MTIRWCNIWLMVLFTSGASAGDSCLRGGELLKVGRYEDAKSMFMEEARLEHACGYYQLGVMYNFGRGVPQDRARAQQLFQRAFALGGGSVPVQAVQEVLHTR